MGFYSRHIAPGLVDFACGAKPIAYQRRKLIPQASGVVLEIGAGTHVPTVRLLGESLGLPLIRINPGEADMGSVPGVGIAAGALEALEALNAAL